MHHILDFLLRYGLWVLFGWVLAEQMGAPVPSPPILLATGTLIALHHGSFARATAVVLAAAAVADLFWYELGRYRGTSVLRLLCRISLEPDSCVSRTEDWFRRLGLWSLVIAKFAPGIGGIAPPMAGLLRIPILRFLAADWTGIVLWSSAYLGAGYIFREQLEDVANFTARLGGSILVVVIALASLWVAYKFCNRRRFLRGLRIARVKPEEVFERLSDFVILDLRSAAEVEREGLKLPGAIWFERKELAGRHDEIPRDRDIVLYCS